MKKIIFLCALLLSGSAFASVACIMDDNLPNGVKTRSEIGKTYDIAIYCIAKTNVRDFRPVPNNSQIQVVSNTCSDIMYANAMCTIRATWAPTSPGFYQFNFNSRLNGSSGASNFARFETMVLP